MNTNSGYFAQEENIILSFAEKLRKLRIEAGFSQKNVADILNISRSTYTYYETGKTTPDPATLTRISRIFGVPIEEFLPESDSSLDSQLILYDSGARRPPKKVKADPVKVGDLSVDEKTIIAFIRDRNLSSEKIIELLERFYSMPDIPKTY